MEPALFRDCGPSEAIQSYCTHRSGLPRRSAPRNDEARNHPRHAELVSVSMSRHSPAVLVAGWTLKQVQGDELSEVGAEM